MSNNEDELEDEQEPDLNSYLKFIDGEPILLNNYIYKLTPQTVGESHFTMGITDSTKKFEERDSDKNFSKFIARIGSYKEEFNQILKGELFQRNFKVLETAEPKTIEELDSTEIIRDERSMETLSETNQFLVLKNDELTKDLKILTKNYEILTKETKDEIARLNKRIEELIESKVSVSRTPSYWIDEVFSEEFERENVDE